MHLLQDMANVPIEPGSERWRVRLNSIKVNNLVLICLVNISEAPWKPKLLLLLGFTCEQA